MAAWQALGESVIGAVRAWVDPRERELRRRRRARRTDDPLQRSHGRRGAERRRDGGAGRSGVDGCAPGGCQRWSSRFRPCWPRASTTACGASPCRRRVRCAEHCRRANSSARAPMTRLSRAEHSLAELYPVIERSAMVPADELAETMAAAASAAVALRALGDDVVAMERARVGAETAVQRDLDRRGGDDRHATRRRCRRVRGSVARRRANGDTDLGGHRRVARDGAPRTA